VQEDVWGRLSSSSRPAASTKQQVCCFRGMAGSVPNFWPWLGQCGLHGSCACGGGSAARLVWLYSIVLISTQSLCNGLLFYA
jgi:hypothetical protein